MNEQLKELQATLARKYLGRGGIHALNIDEPTQTVTVYVEENADTAKAVTGLEKDAGNLEVRTLKRRRARLL